MLYKQLKALLFFLVALWSPLGTPTLASAAPNSRQFEVEIIAVSKVGQSSRGNLKRVRFLRTGARARTQQALLCEDQCRKGTKVKFSPVSFELCPNARLSVRLVRINGRVFIKRMQQLKAGNCGQVDPDPKPTASASIAPSPTSTPGPSQPPQPDPTLTPTASATPTPFPKLKLPLEVLGKAGTTEVATLRLTASEAAQAHTLYLLTHGLQYDDKGLVTINRAHSVPLRNSAVKVLGNAKSYGGIGGGFHTMGLEITLPPQLLQEGDTRIEFIYTRKDSYQTNGFTLPENQIDDASSGFRILKLNLRDQAGRELLSQAQFEYDDPLSWGPPTGFENLGQAIVDGAALWRGKKADGTPYKLKNHSPSGLTGPEMIATCSDCHAHDGRDLKYYNYSNRSIIERAKIHGLSEDEGKRIAAYIRTLPNTPIVAQARPWNPPFQPGPGLDSKPVYEWAAGAGIEAVLDDPFDLFNYLFPGSYAPDSSGKKIWDASKISVEPLRSSANISMREAPTALQLMDWNHWLPKVHPIDGYADLIQSNSTFKAGLEWYQKTYAGTGNINSLRAHSAAKNFTLVAAITRNLDATFMSMRNSYPMDPEDHSLREAQRRYALPLLLLTKIWEVYMEFDLGDKVAQATCGSQADARSWRVGTLPFNISPNMANIKNTNEPGVPSVELRDGHALGHNTTLNFRYFSSAWYHLQLILDHGNRNPLCGVSAGAPLDWGYVMGHLKDLQSTTLSGVSNIPLLYLYNAKGTQIFDTGLGVDRANNGGWNPLVTMPLPVQEFSYGGTLQMATLWRDVTPQAKGKLMEVLYRAWLDMNKASSVGQYYTPVILTVPTSALAYQGPDQRIMTHGPDNLANRVYKMLTWKVGNIDLSTTGFGVSSTLHNELVDWAKSIWPTHGDGTPAPWDQIRR
jgi:hypothetical protein